MKIWLFLYESCCVILIAYQRYFVSLQYVAIIGTTNGNNVSSFTKYPQIYNSCGTLMVQAFFAGFSAFADLEINAHVHMTTIPSAYDAFIM